MVCAENCASTAPDTLNKAFKLGKRLYTVLVKRSNDTIGKNPFDGALAPRILGKPRNALRSDLVPKLNSICSMMPDSRFKRAVVLALHTGMRIGEVCGLRWCDVDFEAGFDLGQALRGVREGDGVLHQGHQNP